MIMLTYELENHINLLNKSFIINCLTSTLKNFSKRSETYTIALKMFEEDIVNSFETIYEKNKIRAVAVGEECWKCG